MMLVDKRVLCVEDATQFNPSIPGMYQMDMRHTAPGYTRLCPLELVTSNEGIDYVSQMLTMKLMIDYNNSKPESDLWTRHWKQGPSMCCVTFCGMSFDFVISYRCHCPSILVPWLTRRRQHDWPSRRTLDEAATLDAHIVPVGFKRSAESDLEWRICFTPAELALVHSFNDTQTKVYILLKYLAKTVLKPVCEGMTSYVMKNITLWMSEMTETSRFTADRLVDNLVRCLRLLSIYVRAGCLPSYMIPDRNLLSGNLRPLERKSLLSVLAGLIDEGGDMLLRCDTLRLAMVKMYKTPDMARDEGERRNKFEHCCLLMGTQSARKCHIDGTTNISDCLSLVCHSFEDETMAELIQHCLQCLPLPRF